ncbi:MAG: alpha/beta hydrolase [Gemmatimonadaceae bacterium]|nr:alpha/beta hydrolase [Gemmatimonadaceae bacterium]
MRAHGRRSAALPAAHVALLALLVATVACGAHAPPPPPPPPLLAPTDSAVNFPPMLAVSGNAPTGEVTYGATLALSASCTDREDGALATVRWTTDDGQLLGEGSALRLMPEPGSYLVLATCSDRSGRSATMAATSRFVVVDRWSSADSIPLTVTLPYATNRGGGTPPHTSATMYDGTLRDSLVRGVLTVNVPARDGRKAGTSLRSPFVRSIRGNVAADDVLRLSVRAADVVDSLAMAARLGAAMAESAAGDLLLFIHGFNTSFASAAERAARLAVELQYPGGVVLFTWPSDGLLASYRGDQSEARVSGRALAAFLRELQLAAPSRRLSVIAHSMGSEVFAAALRELDAPHAPLRLGHVVLVSPDLAADDFLAHLLPSLRSRAADVTVYAASADFALWSSWGSNGARRLGLGGRFATIARGVETIEVPYDATDALGHNPFRTEPFRNDLHALLVNGLPAARRGLVTLPRADGKVMWRLP